MVSSLIFDLFQHNQPLSRRGKIGTCPLTNEARGEATCMRFVENKASLRKTPTQRSFNLPAIPERDREDTDSRRIGPSIRYSYGQPRKMHHINLASISLYCVECGQRTSAKKSFLAPICEQVIHLACWPNHKANCKHCSATSTSSSFLETGAQLPTPSLPTIRHRPVGPIVLWSTNWWGHSSLGLIMTIKSGLQVQ